MKRSRFSQESSLLDHEGDRGGCPIVANLADVRHGCDVGTYVHG